MWIELGQCRDCRGFVWNCDHVACHVRQGKRVCNRPQGQWLPAHELQSEEHLIAAYPREGE